MLFGGFVLNLLDKVAQKTCGKSELETRTRVNNIYLNVVASFSCSQQMNADADSSLEGLYLILLSSTLKLGAGGIDLHSAIQVQVLVE